MAKEHFFNHSPFPDILFNHGIHWGIRAEKKTTQRFKTLHVFRKVPCSSGQLRGMQLCLDIFENNNGWIMADGLLLFPALWFV